MARGRQCVVCNGHRSRIASEHWDEVQAAIPPRLQKLACGLCLAFAARAKQLNDEDFTPVRLEDQLRRLDQLVGGLPLHGGWRREIFHRDLPDQGLIEAMKVAGDVPTIGPIRDYYGSWTEALQAAGVAAMGSRENVFGIQTSALDGHQCYSVGELTIDDWLTANGVSHDREPRYPDSDLRGDFLVGDIIIEYLGLAGDPEYDAITDRKRSLARTHGLNLYEITPEDMADWPEASHRLAQLLNVTPVANTPAPPSVGQEPVSGRYVTAAERRRCEGAAVRRQVRSAGWEPDPFGAGVLRYQDGHAWTRKIRTHDGHDAVHTPTVALEVSRQAWEIMDDETRRYELWDHAEQLASRAGADSTAMVEWYLAWMDAGENHVVKFVADIYAGGGQPWSRIEPWPHPYLEAAEIFKRTGRLRAEGAIRARLHDVRAGGSRIRLEQLTHGGYLPDDLAAGLSVEL